MLFHLSLLAISAILIIDLFIYFHAKLDWLLKFKLRGIFFLKNVMGSLRSEFIEILFNILQFRSYNAGNCIQTGTRVTRA